MAKTAILEVEVNLDVESNPPQNPQNYEIQIHISRQITQHPPKTLDNQTNPNVLPKVF